MKRIKPYAYAGKILRVDLSTGAISSESTIEYAHKWLGGRGINQWILYSELRPWVTPYEPANRLVIGTGPLTGTLAPGANRHNIDSRNVFSWGVGSANSGGHFAAELKFAGYDHIVLQGRARNPVYLWIDDDHVQLREAKRIWGATTWETDDLLKEELDDERIQLICIGPAGENLVRGACIIANKNRAAGKCGLGAIMGSKNLKAIAVRGKGSVEVAQPDRFMRAVDDAWKKLESCPSIQQMSKYGTMGILYHKNEKGGIPRKNFQDNTIPPESLKEIDPDKFQTKYKERDMGYMACPVSCSNFYRIDHGPYAGLATEGVELETVVDFAARLAIDCASVIIKGHALCNQLGLDLDNATGPIAWAFECYQRGILTKKETDGLQLEWGDHGVVFELIRKIAYREGFGNILAEGSKHASEIIGKDSGYYAVHMKGQDLYEEVRLPIGWGLGTCVATRGGGHTTGAPSVEASAESELGEKVYGVKNLADPTAYEGKPELVVYFERQQAIVNSLILCMFMTNWVSPTLLSLRELAELYSAGTGWETTESEFRRTGERIVNLEKAFNVLHANLGRQDDYPSERFLKEPITSGRFKGFALSRDKYDKMLDRYYELHRWHHETGLQTRKCLEDLDLEDITEDLRRRGKLAEE